MDMDNQNKIFSFKIKRQTKNVFPRDVERTVSVNLITLEMFEMASNTSLAKDCNFHKSVSDPSFWERNLLKCHLL